VSFYPLKYWKISITVVVVGSVDMWRTAECPNLWLEGVFRSKHWAVLRRAASTPCGKIGEKITPLQGTRFTDFSPIQILGLERNTSQIWGE
jgi:hypothetical protein